MSFTYTPQLIDNAYTYTTYRQAIDDMLAQPPANAAAEKVRTYIIKNVEMMAEYDETYEVFDSLKEALAKAPATTWLVLTEGWCGDAAFNIPMLHVIEKAMPDKVKLRLLFRDSNLDVMDANLTDGGRSIPKMVVLSDELQVLGHWGPRPGELQILLKAWKAEGLTLHDIIPNVHAWYNANKTYSLQTELKTLIESYS
jgi:hypothetical protein